MEVILDHGASRAKTLPRAAFDQNRRQASGLDASRLFRWPTLTILGEVVLHGLLPCRKLPRDHVLD